MMRTTSFIVGVALSLVCASRVAAQDVQNSYDEVPAEETADFETSSEPVGLAGRIAFGGTLDVLWHLGTAHDVFSTTPATVAGGLSASLTVLELAPRLLLDVGVGWRAEAPEAPVLQSATASYAAHSVVADAALRFELLPWLVPRARVSAGIQYLSASLAPYDAGTPLEGDAFSFVSSVGAGVELLGRLGEGLSARAGRPAAVTLFLVVEGGIVLGTSSSLTVSPREPADDEAAADRIPVVGTDLGSLGGIAPYLRIAGGVRF